MRLKSTKRREIFIVLLVILAVMPGYTQIAGHNVTSMLTPVLMVTYFLTNGKVQFHKCTNKEIPLFLFIIFRIIAYIANGELFTAAAFVIFLLFSRQLIYDYVTDEEKLERVIDIILNVAVVLGILGLFEAITEQNFFLLLNNSGQIITRNERRLGIIRIISFTTQTSHYSIYCCICLFLSLYMYYTKANKKRYRNINILLLANLIFTGTRMVILVMVGCYALIQFRRSSTKFFRRSMVLLIGVVIILLFMNQTYIGQLLIMFMSQIIPGLESLLKADAVASAEQSNIIGSRLQLYSWVFNSMSGHWLTGYGEKVEFSYEYVVRYMGYSWTQIKDSIEVNYLSMIYHYGILSMITETFMMIWNLYKSFKASYIEKKLYGRMRFMSYCHYIFLMIILCWFGTMVGEERFTFYIVLFLFTKYNQDNKKWKRFKRTTLTQ